MSMMESDSLAGICEWLETYARVERGRAENTIYARALASRYANADELASCCEDDFIAAGLLVGHARRASRGATELRAARSGVARSAEMRESDRAMQHHSRRRAAADEEADVDDDDSDDDDEDDDDVVLKIRSEDGSTEVSVCVSLGALSGAVMGLRRLERSRLSGGGSGVLTLQRTQGGQRGLQLEANSEDIEDDDDESGAATPPSLLPEELAASMTAMEVCEDRHRSLDHDVDSWKPSDVARWLSGFDALKGYAALSTQLGVGGKQLSRVRGRADVEKVLGITLAIHQRLVLTEIKQLLRIHNNTNARTFAAAVGEQQQQQQQQQQEEEEKSGKAFLKKKTGGRWGGAAPVPNDDANNSRQQRRTQRRRTAGTTAGATTQRGMASPPQTLRPPRRGLPPITPDQEGLEQHETGKGVKRRLVRSREGDPNSRARTTEAARLTEASKNNRKMERKQPLGLAIGETKDSGRSSSGGGNDDGGEDNNGMMMMMSPNQRRNNTMLRSNSAPVASGEEPHHFQQQPTRNKKKQLDAKKKASLSLSPPPQPSSEKGRAVSVPLVIDQLTETGSMEDDDEFGGGEEKVSRRQSLGLGTFGQDLGLQMDLAAVDRDLGNNAEDSYDFSKSGTLLDWKSGLAIKGDSKNNMMTSSEHTHHHQRGVAAFGEDDKMSQLVGAASAVTTVAADELLVQKEQLLGSGACASVRRALHAPTLTLVAVKMVAVHDDGKRRQLLRELAALHQFSTVALQDAHNPKKKKKKNDADDADQAMRAHIVAFYGAFTDPAVGCVCAVLEYMDSRSLHDAMGNRNWEPLDDDSISVVAHGAIAGLAALHRDRQLHRDVKLSNILLDWRWRVKLSDFGVSRALDNTLGLAQTYVGTLLFMAPERIVAGEYSYASDIWSIGLCFATMALGKIPLPHDDGYWAVVRAICDGEPPQLDASKHDPAMAKITNDCLRREAKHRPDATTLLRDDPFVHRGAALELESRRGALGLPVWFRLRTPDGKLQSDPSKEQLRDLAELARSAAHWRRQQRLLQPEPEDSRQAASSSSKPATPTSSFWSREHIEGLAEQLHLPTDVVRKAFRDADRDADRRTPPNSR